jgi:hypothetical protein
MYLLLLAGCSNETENIELEQAETGTVVADDSLDINPDSVHSIKRQPFFGDLHVHSSYSLDSYVNFNPVDPEQAYRFARGEEVSLSGRRRSQLDRPLDFAAVTDHAEYFGELSLCLDQDEPQYTLPLCVDIRNDKQERDFITRVYKNFIIRDVTSPAPQRENSLCGEDNSACHERARSIWQKIIEVADAYNSPGEFTTFVAYEWTGNTNFNNLHRNIIFRNNHVPSLPASLFEANTPALLWRQLSEGCKAPCDVLGIPHNSNQSKGRQFPTTVSLEDAQVRSELEPLVEIIQGKGNSECQMGVGTADEYCNFELLESRPVCSGEGNENASECVHVCSDQDESGTCIQKNIYFRNALKDGLRLEETLGVNPYKFGVIGSTDTHNGTPGATDESNYMGLFGAEDATPEGRAQLPAIKSFKPPRLHSASGLAGVWAEENTRDSIFDALKRKETFATSGTRIVLRFFGAWDFGNSTSDEVDITTLGYQEGVSMGGDFPSITENAVPDFIFWAMKAVDGAPLQRVQIIKGWREDDGSHEATYDVVCSDGFNPDPVSHRCPDNGADVDLKTCVLSNGQGAVELKGRWRDPDFNPTHPAFYYVRVLENPSCRWSTWEALREGKPQFDDVVPTIQERAWSSPIWYSP